MGWAAIDAALILGITWPASLLGSQVMRRVVPIFMMLLLAGCAATDPHYIAQKQAKVLASAETTCASHRPADGMQIYLTCLNAAVHSSGYWGQGIRVVAANDGTPQLIQASGHKYCGFDCSRDVTGVAPLIRN